MKKCKYCNKSYPEEDFGVALTLPDKVYRRQKCRYCYRQTKRQLIVKHRIWIREYKKAGKCTVCGIKDFRVLDFHHNGNGKEKIFNIADFRYKAGFKKLEEEAKKCSLLCANCHRIAHYKDIEDNKAITGIGAVG